MRTLPWLTANWLNSYIVWINMTNLGHIICNKFYFNWAISHLLIGWEPWLIRVQTIEMARLLCNLLYFWQIFFAFASWIIVGFEMILWNTGSILHVSCLGLLQTDTTHALYYELSDVRTYMKNKFYNNRVIFLADWSRAMVNKIPLWKWNDGDIICFLFL